MTHLAPALPPRDADDAATLRTAGQFDAMRAHMIESQLRTSDVNDPALLRVIAEVPREAFVPLAFRGAAYMDRALPLAPGRMMSPPLTLGRLIIAAAPKAHERALLIGTATGYAAAILAPLVDTLVAVEEDTALADVARAKLASHGNVRVVTAPLVAGAAEAGPFDLIVIDGAIEEMPGALIAQLAPQGRVVAGLLDRGVTRLARGVRSGEAIVFNPFADMEAPVLPSFAKPRTFQF